MSSRPTIREPAPTAAEAVERLERRWVPNP